MWHSWRLRAAALLVGLAAGCQPAATTPIPTAVLWTVQRTPALAWMGAQMNTCTQQLPGIALAVHELPAPALKPENAAISLLWGALETVPGAAFELGQDELAFIVHPSNEAGSLSLEDIQAIYKGSVRSWGRLAPEGSEAGGRINVWEYPRGNDVQQVFESAIRRQDEPRAFVSLAPDPAAMVQAVAEDPAAIGFVPRRWLDDSVRAVEWEGEPPAEASQPVVALTAAEPDPLEREWLLCLQDAWIPTE